MTNAPVASARWLGMMTLAALTGCQSDPLCFQDDPHTFVLQTTDRATGEQVEGISGIVKGDIMTQPIRCYRYGGIERCYGWARGRYATIRIEREGYLPWDTLNVRLRYEGNECRRPVEQILNVQLTAAPVLISDP